MSPMWQPNLKYTIQFIKDQHSCGQIPNIQRAPHSDEHSTACARRTHGATQNDWVAAFRPATFARILSESWQALSLPNAPHLIVGKRICSASSVLFAIACTQLSVKNTM